MNLTFQCENWPGMVEELKGLVHIQYNEIALDKREIPLDPDWSRYEKWASEGLLSVTTVRDSGRLVGWHVSMVGMHPHYRTSLFAAQDMYYLLPEYRSMPTIGFRMFMAMEEEMRRLGVREIIGNTKCHFDKSPLFERLGWAKTATVYRKVLA